MSDSLVVGVLTPSSARTDALETALASVYDEVQIHLRPQSDQSTASIPASLDCHIAVAPLPDEMVTGLDQRAASGADVPLVVLATSAQAGVVRDQQRVLGIADVVVADGSDDRRYQRLADRVRGVVQQRRRAALDDGEGVDPGGAVRALYEIATNADLSFEEKADRILEIGVDRLGVENAHLSTIDREPDRYEILASVGELPIEPGELMDLPATFCRRTIESDEVLALNHASEQGWEDDPAYERSGIECYLGSRITVGGQLYGTVCFLDRNPHAAFTESERTFVSLVARWLSHELERTRRESALDVLNVATTELLGATSQTDACEIVAETARSLVDAAVARLWLADEADRTMRALTGDGTDRTGPLVRRNRAEGAQLWETLESGTIQQATELVVSDTDARSCRSVALVPLDTEGVLEVGAPSSDAFDEIDVSLLRMLAASGVAALDRAERQAELQAARERFERIFESANDALFLLDPMADAVVECNSRACELLDYDRDALLETAPSTLYRESGARYRAFIEEVQSSGGGWTDDLSMQRQDGRRFPVEVSAAIVELPDQTCLLTSVRDITRRRLREQALAVFNRVLRHNIRNDMNVIVGQAELLAEGLTDPEQQSQVAEIRRMGQDLLSLGEKARLFQQLDDREQETLTVDIRQTLGRVAESLETEYPGASIEIDGPRAMATVDPTIDIAFRELCENAVEHADSPDPTVRITISRLYTDEQFEVTVADDGPGLSDQDRAVLEEGVETPLQHGSGLGLWIATWVVERSGGSISVPQTSAEGTTIRVVLPTATDVEGEAAGEWDEGDEFDAG